jgi:maleylacetoacetate isomerase
MLKLYSYFRSSAAYRCRIALNLKGVAHDRALVPLIKEGGPPQAPANRAHNPPGRVPALEDEGKVITQSLAIIEYLEDIHPEPPLLPRSAIERAMVRAFALAIACDIHPIDNLRVLDYLKGPMQQDQAAVDAWYRHWIKVGLAACEALLPAASSRYSFGDRPTLADACLVPQLYNARRFNCDLSAVPRLVAIDAACRALPAFAKAAPEAQPDAA